MKNQSDSKGSDLPLESLTFFLDESNMAPELIAALKEQGATVEIHHDHFESGVPDVIWLPQVAEKGWIILTRDNALRYVPREKEALINSAARVFIFTQKNASGAQMAQTLTQSAHAIKRFVRNKVKSHEMQFVARIPREKVIEDCKIS